MSLTGESLLIKLVQAMVRIPLYPMIEIETLVRHSPHSGSAGYIYHDDFSLDVQYREKARVTLDYPNQLDQKCLSKTINCTSNRVDSLEPDICVGGENVVSRVLTWIVISGAWWLIGLLSVCDRLRNL